MEVLAAAWAEAPVVAWDQWDPVVAAWDLAAAAWDPAAAAWDLAAAAWDPAAVVWDPAAVAWDPAAAAWDPVEVAWVAAVVVAARPDRVTSLTTPAATDGDKRYCFLVDVGSILPLVLFLVESHAWTATLG